MKNMNLVPGLLICSLLATQASTYAESCTFLNDQCSTAVSFVCTESEARSCQQKSATITLKYQTTILATQELVTYTITGPQNYSLTQTEFQKFDGSIVIKNFSVPYAGSYIITTTVFEKNSNNVILCTFSRTVTVKNRCLALLMCCKDS